MTEPDPLPGLEPPVHGASPLELAVRRSLAALDKAGLIPEEQAARTALAIELAQIITLKRRSGRMSTIGNDARVLVELLDKLLPEAPEEDGADEALRRALEAWEAEATAEGIEP